MGEGMAGPLSRPTQTRKTSREGGGNWGRATSLPRCFYRLEPFRSASYSESMGCPCTQVRAQDMQSQRYKVLECYALMAGKVQVGEAGRGGGGTGQTGEVFMTSTSRSGQGALVYLRFSE